jgi:thiol:disulfide interchange protein/DsbC/DsbD-like thiol-disulfide interchange protein
MRLPIPALTALLLALLAQFPLVAAAQPQSATAVQLTGPSARSQNVEITLLSARAAVAPGETVTVALRQTMADGWHTYWRNPGDSGDATRIDWALPAGATAGPIRWPTPMALPFGPLMNYGYEGEVLLPVDITVPAGVQPGANLQLVADASWLECADICIPGSGRVAIQLPVEAAGRDGPDAGAIRAALARLPQPLPARGVLTDSGDAYIVSVPASAFAGVGAARFFPHEIEMGALIDYPAAQALETGPAGLSLTIPKSPSAPAELSGSYSGVLVTGTGGAQEAFEVQLGSGPVPAGVQGVAPRPASMLQAPGLWQALLLAALGGLILNLMPCVFPILAMKALGLVSAAQGHRREVALHGLLYGAGVLVAFLSLAGIMIALQTAGNAVGWGFQLQSPVVTLALSVLMFAIGLNLMGVLTVGGRIQSIGADAAGRSGPLGAFLSGLLAVVVASPCTAPFMGAALGYAAVSPPLASMAVFAALGVGFAAPFVLVTMAPGALARLPRPGPWMETFRQVLAFPMFGAALWLVWVLAAQTGQTGVLAAGASMLAVGFAGWMGMRFARRPVRLTGLAVVLAVLVTAVVLVRAPGTSDRATGPDAAAMLPDSGAWSPQAVQAELAAGRSVFVNFTADWCVTCKVNEATVFARDDVRALFAEGKAVYLVADWTSRDSRIAAALREHGRIGVPLYLVYHPGEPEPRVLPQILTPSVVSDALMQ